MYDGRLVARELAAKAEKELMLRRGRHAVMGFIRSNTSKALEYVPIPNTPMVILFNIGDQEFKEPESKVQLYARLIEVNYPVCSMESVKWLGDALTEEALIGLIGIYHKEIYNELTGVSK